MTVQATSMKVYKEDVIPKLGQKQEVVYNTFRVYGDASNLEIATFLCCPINQVTPRTNELVKMNLLEIKDKRKCKISDKLVLIWGVARQPEEQEMQDDKQFDLF